MTTPARPLRAHQPRLFETPTVQHDLRRLIKDCLRSGHPWTETQQWVLGDLLRVVNRFGRLPTAQHRLLLCYCRKAGVRPS
jgi:hypothetical protein